MARTYYDGSAGAQFLAPDEPTQAEWSEAGDGEIHQHTCSRVATGGDAVAGEAKRIRAALIAGGVTSPDGTFVHASISEVVAALRSPDAAAADKRCAEICQSLDEAERSSPDIAKLADDLAETVPSKGGYILVSAESRDEIVAALRTVETPFCVKCGSAEGCDEVAARALASVALADNLKREAKVRRDHPDDYDAEITSWIEQAEQIVRATSVANPPAQPVPQPAKISDGTIDTLLSKLDQGAAYQGYPEGFGFSWTKLAGDAAVTIRRLRGSSITSTEGK